ncbi:MAG: DUF72 domain-containing protein [Treponema sp.]|nr:DUF72 domain-containing protein [Treponema sp.]
MSELLIGTSGYDYPEWKGTFYPAENRIYLAKLIEDFVGFPVVVEFRHREWIKPSVFEGLYERGTGIVFCDIPQRKLTLQLRLFGSRTERICAGSKRGTGRRKAGAKEMALLYNARKINNYARLTNFQGLDDSLSLKK